MFNRKYIFKRSIFHCYVSLPECITIQKFESDQVYKLSPQQTSPLFTTFTSKGELLVWNVYRNIKTYIYKCIHSNSIYIILIYIYIYIVYIYQFIHIHSIQPHPFFLGKNVEAATLETTPSPGCKGHRCWNQWIRCTWFHTWRFHKTRGVQNTGFSGHVFVKGRVFGFTC